ncbi:cell division protein ZapA [Snodgrassella alvi]|jgi:cell division protein ZapA|uniref:Cell division protein ZapA n=1 Tax=Snodgrassella alvi TaxID=1196083 RepID=A0A2N9XZC3_9NEIS|nr:cell division protein ZapA [Snodgrassella alvi]PIT54001.1 cell division protein ZapA [Snodgrassella alvi]PIT56631.1 cell division protein ZapA [Snodgrassella alvi]
MDEIQQVRVEILGRPFNIGTPRSEHETLMQAVKMLNEKIVAIQSSGRIVETDKIVIMAALNLTHDLLKLTMHGNLAVGDFERKMQDMIQLCESTLTLVVK